MAGAAGHPCGLGKPACGGGCCSRLVRCGVQRDGGLLELDVCEMSGPRVWRRLSPQAGRIAITGRLRVRTVVGVADVERGGDRAGDDVAGAGDGFDVADGGDEAIMRLA